MKKEVIASYINNLGDRVYLTVYINIEGNIEMYEVTKCNLSDNISYTNFYYSRTNASIEFNTLVSDDLGSLIYND